VAPSAIDGIDRLSVAAPHGGNGEYDRD